MKVINCFKIWDGLSARLKTCRTEKGHSLRLAKFRATSSYRAAFVVSLALATSCDSLPDSSFTGAVPSSSAHGVVKADVPKNLPVTGPEAEKYAPARKWLPLEADHLHDPDNPAIKLLQDPREALGALPFAYQGNQVDWAAALREGLINPRTNVYPETKVNSLDLDIIFPDTKGQPMVVFPHKQHTDWLDCSNCHDKIFKKEAGATPVSMFAILSGDYCGQCHGAVSFPLTQCKRCHSLPREGANK